MNIKDKKLNLRYKNTIIGKALLRFYSDGDVFLTDFVIDPAFRNMGLGTKFMKIFIDKYGVNCLTVNPNNVIALNMYLKFGFNIVDNEYYDENAGETVVYMRREMK